MDLNNETRLRVDPKTGFMESPRKDRVPIEVKQQILEIYRQTGNLTEACRTAGADPRNIRIHMAADGAFKRAIDEVRQQICDRAESFVVKHMERPGNVIDRLAWLRAYRPGVWNPAKDQTVNVNVNHLQQGVDKAGAYEAELVTRLEAKDRTAYKENTFIENGKREGITPPPSPIPFISPSTPQTEQKGPGGNF